MRALFCTLPDPRPSAPDYADRCACVATGRLCRDCEAEAAWAEAQELSTTEERPEEQPKTNERNNP